MKRPLSSFGILDTDVTSANPYLMVGPTFASANLTSTILLTSGTCLAFYLGRAPRTITTATFKWRVTTGATTVTWGEVALAKGALVVSGNASLTVIGYTDVATPIASASLKSTTINVSSGQNVNRGDDIWGIIGVSATVAATLRAQSIADNLQTGVQQGLAVQPSTVVGVAQTWTLEAVGNTAPWMALVV